MPDLGKKRVNAKPNGNSADVSQRGQLAKFEINENMLISNKVGGPPMMEPNDPLHARSHRKGGKTKDKGRLVKR